MSEYTFYHFEQRADRFAFPNDTTAMERTQERLLYFMQRRLTQIGVDRYVYTVWEIQGASGRELRLRAEVRIDNAQQP